MQVWAIILVVKSLWTSACWLLFKKNKLGSGGKKKFIFFFFLFNDMIVLQWGKVLFFLLLLLVFCLELCMIFEAWVSLFSSTAALVLFS